MIERVKGVALAASLLLMSTTALADVAPPKPRETVGAVAAAIEKNYFDPQKAAKIAAELRAEAKKGAYDKLRDPKELAAKLTQRLSPLDGHFDVKWVGDRTAPAGAPAAAAAPLPDAEVLARRSGYGFPEVRILPGNIGYIKMRMFEPIDFSDPNWPVKIAADNALGLVSKTNGIIFDLRTTPGGEPSMVGYLTSAFVEPGADVYNTFHGAGGRTEKEVPGEPYATPMTDVPVYILTSGRTGSAAEGFAYTMQAAKRGKVIGTRSYGAANPGGAMPAGDDFTVFVSLASPKNPITGGNWEGTGVKPDVQTTPEAALKTAHALALETAIPTLPPEEKMDSVWVLEALRANPPAMSQTDLQAIAGRYGSIDLIAMTGGLEMRQEGRLSKTLLPLSQDVFYVDTDPSERLYLERDGAGKVVRVESRWTDGGSIIRNRK